MHRSFGVRRRTRRKQRKSPYPGSTRIEARAERASGLLDDVVIRGTLRDDVGKGVAESHVAIELYEPGSAVAIPLPAPLRCTESAGAHEPHAAPDEYVVDTDSQGSFCLHTMLPPEPLVMKLHFAGGGLLEGTAAEVPIESQGPSMRIVFDPEPYVISLDRPTFEVALRVTAGHLDRDRREVRLQDETGHALGHAEVDPDGRCRIEVRTADLGTPGLGELRATLEGAARGPALSAIQVVERHARVELEIVTPNPDGVPEDGIALAVVARSSRGPVTSGAVEATLNNATVGAAELHDGKAALTATFAMRASPAIAMVRYLPSAPWWEPGTPRTVPLAIRPATGWRHLPAVLLALGVAAWMLRRIPAGRSATRRQESKEKPVLGNLSEVRVNARHSAHEGWTGQVRDAHDGSAIANATVSIVIAAFPGSSASNGAPDLTTRTDLEGLFALTPSAPVPKGALLRVRAAWHSDLERPLPEPSDLLVPMIARRRMILERLVQWGTREWGPWKGARDPSPRQVGARAHHPAEAAVTEAADPHATAVQTWARAVESAAFGPTPVDEAAEHAVRSLEPKRRA